MQSQGFRVLGVGHIGVSEHYRGLLHKGVYWGYRGAM